MKRITGILIVCAGMLASGCKKDETMSIDPQLLTGSWILSAELITPQYDYDGDGIEETDIIPFYEPCELDDVLVFASNMTGELNEGDSRCDATDDQLVFYFDWSLSAGNRLEIKRSVGGTSTFNLLEATGNAFRMSYQFSEFGVLYTRVYTYRKI